MKSVLVIISVTAYVLSSIALPIMAYTCPMSGETGVTVDTDGSLPTCVPDACCDTEPDEPTVRLESGTSCCEFTAQGCATDGLTILSGFKYHPERLVTASHVDVNMTLALIDTRIARVPPHSRLPINAPLLI